MAVTSTARLSNLLSLCRWPPCLAISSLVLDGARDNQACRHIPKEMDAVLVVVGDQRRPTDDRELIHLGPPLLGCAALERSTAARYASPVSPASLVRSGRA